ncbi:MAG TPA: 2-oxo-4-hydroxy-4-carboxy-5-ureidoimidazoline decarboxylase [Patescibacteria group bacterium]|nr:2-oxo-4-hydroxy-4-carboxy-5-ureidoimidazoline decarboxylase [Patescibacteria group bacterium]
MDIATLDALPEPDFVAAVGPWFEGGPRFLGRLAAARPFRDESTFFARAAGIAAAMPESDQLELINAHPRLGAPPASVSPASFREQGYDRETSAAIADLERLNLAYEARHGFRYCVFVNGRSRPELVPVLEAALDADREAEIRRAVADVVAIARDRCSRESAVGPRVEGVTA